MRDRSHMEQVERWARFVRDNPRSAWKSEQGAFIDAKIMMARRFYSVLEQTPGGAEKIKRLRSLA